MNETDNLIRALYAHITIDDWQHFRPKALEETCIFLGASAGAWITYGSGGAVWGEFTAYPATPAIMPRQLMSLPFRGAKEISLPANLALEGLRHGVALSYAHQSSDLTSVMVFWFASKDKVPGGEALWRVVSHLAEAGSLSLRQYIQRDEWLASLGRANRGTAALVDAGGTVYAATQRFRTLIGEAFGSADFGALPFQLPEEAFSEHGLFGQGELRFRASKVGDLYILHARKPLPLDELSPREQQIARALGNGKTFKTVARQCGIAVSTVANHASRIYRKLGIYRREDLVELIRTPREITRH